MDLPSSAPVGGLVDRAVTGLGLRSSEAALDQAKYLHHAGSPWSLALAALGVVFGDIGTSPLYAFQVALTGLSHSPPVAAAVLGVVSLILWALVMMVSLKYVVFILRADNDGEGGILALLSLVAADQDHDRCRYDEMFERGRDQLQPFHRRQYRNRRRDDAVTI